jgi:hypothetical protein
VDALTKLLGDERGKVEAWERRYGAQGAEYKLARKRLMVLADECIAARDKLSAMMLRVNLAPKGDTIDDLLAELEAQIVALQVKNVASYEGGYEEGSLRERGEAIKIAHAVAGEPLPELYWDNARARRMDWASACSRISGRIRERADK